MGALNIPSAGDIERLTRRLRSVSQRLEGIEDGVHQLNRGLSPAGVEARLSAIEEQLQALGARLDAREGASASSPAAKEPRSKKGGGGGKRAGRGKSA